MPFIRTSDTKKVSKSRHYDETKPFKSILKANRGETRLAGRLMLLLLVFLLTLTASHTLVSSIKTIWLFGWLPLLLVWFSDFKDEELMGF